MKPASRVPVWSPAVRLVHWALAGCVLGCLWLYQGGSWHERLGYAAGLVVAWRIGLGFVSGPSHLRFSGFIRGPTATWVYVRALWGHRERRHLGHNPLGRWMIAAVHRGAGWALAGLAPLHVLGVALTSWRQRENLVAALLHGRKRPAAAGEIDLLTDSHRP